MIQITEQIDMEADNSFPNAPVVLSLGSSAMKILRILLLTLGLPLLAACGGGGGGVASGPQGTISGVVTKGPVRTALVSAYAISGGVKGAQIGTATTDVNGAFTMNIGAYAGPVMLQVSGGNYTDEATGSPMSMASGDVMTAVMPAVMANASTSGIQVTPVTAMAQARAQGMAGGMSDANIAAANTAMGQYFSVSDILHTMPMNPLVSGSSAGASPDARNYGITLAAMSQYAATLTMANSSALVTAMMSDASDGVMDGRLVTSQISMSMGGMMGSSMMAPTACTSSLATAMMAFMNSTANVSGVTAADMAALRLQLSGSNGHI